MLSSSRKKAEFVHTRSKSLKCGLDEQAKPMIHSTGRFADLLETKVNTRPVCYEEEI